MRAPTERELAVVTAWADGYSDLEVADQFGISARTVKAHRGQIERKLKLELPRGLIARRRIIRAALAAYGSAS